MRTEQRADGTYIKVPAPSELQLSEAVGREAKERKTEDRRLDDSLKRTQTEMANVRTRMTTLELKWAQQSDSAGLLNIYRDEQGQIIKVLGPDTNSYMWYYDDGRLDFTISTTSTHAIKERYLYDNDGNVVSVDRTMHQLNDPQIESAIATR